MSNLEHQFSIAIDQEIFEGLRAMARVARRHHREQAARLVERDVRNWLAQGQPADSAMLDPDSAIVAA